VRRRSHGCYVCINRERAAGEEVRSRRQGLEQRGRVWSRCGREGECVERDARGSGRGEAIEMEEGMSVCCVLEDDASAEAGKEFCGIGAEEEGH